MGAVACLVLPGYAEAARAYLVELNASVNHAVEYRSCYSEPNPYRKAIYMPEKGCCRDYAFTKPKFRGRKGMSRTVRAATCKPNNGFSLRLSLATRRG